MRKRKNIRLIPKLWAAYTGIPVYLKRERLLAKCLGFKENEVTGLTVRPYPTGTGPLQKTYERQEKAAYELWDFLIKVEDAWKEIA